MSDTLIKQALETFHKLTGTSRMGAPAAAFLATVVISAGKLTAPVVKAGNEHVLAPLENLQAEAMQNIKQPIDSLVMTQQLTPVTNPRPSEKPEQDMGQSPEPE